MYDQQAHEWGKVCNFARDLATGTPTRDATAWLLERVTTGAYARAYPKMPDAAAATAASMASSAASAATAGADAGVSGPAAPSAAAAPNAPPGAPAAVARSKRFVAAVDYAAVAAGPKIPHAGPRLAYNKEWKPGAPWRP